MKGGSCPQNPENCTDEQYESFFGKNNNTNKNNNNNYFNKADEDGLKYENIKNGKEQRKTLVNEDINKNGRGQSKHSVKESRRVLSKNEDNDQIANNSKKKSKKPKNING